MNVVLLVVDSLRACSLGRRAPDDPHTPLLDRLARDTIAFRQARATECWTLPTHLSMFTGLLPSAHGAHFQSMAYAERTPTLAERFAAAGYHTEVVTRNSLFDGTIPGATRGFQRNTRLLAELRVPDPLGVLLALSKPRVRRLIQTSGFFHVLQRDNGAFLSTLARMIIPADHLVLDYTLEQMAAHHRGGKPYLLFLNLYDIHAPYPPRPHSPLRSFASLAGWIENLMLPRLSTQLGSHAYLREGFAFSPRARRILRDRYARAIELMDGKLGAFIDAARGTGLLDDTVLVVVSDHGEAFGEHELFFHDASVYDTHLHVPLWIHHPACAPRTVDDLVSTRDLHGLLANIAEGRGLAGTLLDDRARAARPVALAEHFHYPPVPGSRPRYAQDIAAAVVGRRKLIVRREGGELYDLAADPDERAPLAASSDDFAARCRADGAPEPAVREAVAHVERWWTVAGLPAPRRDRPRRAPIAARVSL